MTGGSISQIENGQIGLTATTALAIEHVFAISRSWLESGHGPMFAPAAAVRALDDVPRDVPAVDAKRFRGTDEGPDDFTTIPILADEAAAGEPRAVSDEQVLGNAVIHKRWIKGSEKHYICLSIKGDSMQPILSDGSMVCVDLRQTDPEKNTNKMVAAVVDDGVTIKWLRRGRKERWLLLPENREHTPFELSAKELRIVGRVVWWWSKAN